jgi:predicted porin
MKKTLVALAALASFGAAFAQSSVTLYGRIDASIGSTKTTTGGVTTADPGIQIRSGGHTGSRWGMRGTEDLGGGLRANFQLEQGFNIDNGAASAAANAFHRLAMVGLSGGFGALTVGRQYDMVDTAYANYDAMGYSGYSAMGYAFNVGCPGAGAPGTGDCVARQNNSVQYKTPAMGGFGLTAMWAPGENKAAGFSAGNMFGVLANYANGPLDVGLMWQSNKAGGAARAITNHMLGASYNLGMAKVFAQYEGGQNKPTTQKDQGFSLGAVINLGAPSLMVSYARENQKIGGNKVSDSTGISLMGQYPLSKRTYVYAAFLRGETDPVAAGAPTVKQQNYGLGLVHNF